MMPPHFQRIVAWRALPPPPYFEADPRVIELLACGHEGVSASRTQVDARIVRQAWRSCVHCWVKHKYARRRCEAP